MGEFCTAEQDGNLLIVTINRPERMNALHPPGNAEMAAIFDDFQANPDLWVAIITGEGERAFCAGIDLRYLAEGGDMSAAATTGFGGITARWDLNKPIIAAVNGVAMGGGFEIALACDLIIASDNARFALPEPKVGLAALAGGVHRLPRQIGLKRAMSMMMTGRHVPAAEGLELGFVNEVVSQDQLMTRTKEWAAMILECSPMSIRATKQAAMRGFENGGIRAAYEGKYDAVSALFKSEDFIEGPKAFSEKRTPNWTGQ